MFVDSSERGGSNVFPFVPFVGWRSLDTDEVVGVVKMLKLSDGIDTATVTDDDEWTASCARRQQATVGQEIIISNN